MSKYAIMTVLLYGILVLVNIFYRLYVKRYIKNLFKDWKNKIVIKRTSKYINKEIKEDIIFLLVGESIFTLGYLMLANKIRINLIVNDFRINLGFILGIIFILLFFICVLALITYKSPINIKDINAYFNKANYKGEK